MGSIAGTVLIKALNKNSKPVDALIGVAMIAPTAVDGAAEYFCGKESNNKRRLITGLIAGFGCAITETSKGSGIYAVYSCDILYIECRQEGMPEYSREYMDRVTKLRHVIDRYYGEKTQRFCGS